MCEPRKEDDSASVDGIERDDAMVIIASRRSLNEAEAEDFILCCLI
jgi:hypothetical protein